MRKKLGELSRSEKEIIGDNFTKTLSKALKMPKTPYNLLVEDFLKLYLDDSETETLIHFYCNIYSYIRSYEDNVKLVAKLNKNVCVIELAHKLVSTLCYGSLKAYILSHSRHSELFEVYSTLSNFRKIEDKLLKKTLRTHSKEVVKSVEQLKASGFLLKYKNTWIWAPGIRILFKELKGDLLTQYKYASKYFKYRRVLYTQSWDDRYSRISRQRIRLLTRGVAM